MSVLRIGTATALVCALLLSAAPSARAYKCKVSEKYDYVSLRWDQRVLEYGIDEGTAVDVNHVEASFGAWSEPWCTDLEFRFVGIVPSTANTNKVLFVTERWAVDTVREITRPPEAVAITLTTYALDSGVIRVSQIEVNDELFDFADATEGCQQGSTTYDLISVVTHEVGHFIGLDHTEAFNGAPDDPTMAPEVGECEADKRTLEADDLSALCLLYPEGKLSGGCAPLPDQPQPYVDNKPFGCATAPGTQARADLWLVLVLFLLGYAAATRRKVRPARGKSQSAHEDLR